MLQKLQYMGYDAVRVILVDEIDLQVPCYPTISLLVINSSALLFSTEKVFLCEIVLVVVRM